MSTEQPITADGILKIQTELDHLVINIREELKITISEARDLGDLKENAEYHAAKERQGIIEGRIMQLQGIVASSRVIDVKAVKSDKIVFVDKITMLDVENDKNVTYQLVGESESDIKVGKVSYKSPLGSALIGKEEGDNVLVRAPKGDIEY